VIQRYILYPLNHTVLVVDVSAIGLPSGFFRPRDLYMVLSYRFHNLSFVREFLLQHGGRLEAVEKAATLVKKGAMCDLTIPGLRQ